MLQRSNQHSKNSEASGLTQVNERAQNMQSAVAGRLKSAGLAAGTDGWCPGKPGRLA